MKFIAHIALYGTILALMSFLVYIAATTELLHHRTPRKVVILGGKNLTYPTAAELEAASFCRKVGHGCRVWE